MNSMLLMFNFSPFRDPFERLVETAHRISRDRPFLLDFPGIKESRESGSESEKSDLNKVAWSTARRHPLGRTLVLYADEDFCQMVRDEALPKMVKWKEEVSLVVIDDALEAINAATNPKDMRGRKVIRRPLRRIGKRYAEKAARKLEAHLAKKGIAPKEPIEVRDFSIQKEDCRTKVAQRKGKRGGPTDFTDRYLVLRSGRGGHRFTSAIIRTPVQEKIITPQGNRDSYGFGGIVPNVSERLILQQVIQREVL